VTEGRALAKTGRGKVVDRGTGYPKIFIYLPMDVVKDSTFPFELGEEVSVTIDGGRLVIEKSRSGRP
jgi:hypothetical protein